MYAFTNRKKQIEREKRLTKSASMPSREVRRIYSRSAFTRRPMDIQPIAKEEPKVNKFAHLDLADEVSIHLYCHILYPSLL